MCLPKKQWISTYEMGKKRHGKQQLVKWGKFDTSPNIFYEICACVCLCLCARQPNKRWCQSHRHAVTFNLANCILVWMYIIQIYILHIWRAMRWVCWLFIHAQCSALSVPSSKWRRLPTLDSCSWKMFIRTSALNASPNGVWQSMDHLSQVVYQFLSFTHFFPFYLVFVLLFIVCAKKKMIIFH